MKLFGDFTFLKLEKGKTKEEKKEFLIISLLDEDLNQCRFFMFDPAMIDKLQRSNLTSYQKVSCCLEVSYYKEAWSVNLADLRAENGK